MLTDTELDAVHLFTGLYSRQMWAYLYGFLLGRTVEVEEVSDAHTRLYDAYYLAHPEQRPRPEDTIASLIRSTAPAFRLKNSA